MRTINIFIDSCPGTTDECACSNFEQSPLWP